MKKKILQTLVFIIFLLNLTTVLARVEKVALNFDNVNINVFLKTMSEITGKSFITSSKVKGNISFVSSKDVPITKVYDIVLSILKASGFYAVPEGDDIVKIYLAQEALKMSGRIYYGTEAVELKEDIVITQIIPLQYASSSDMLNSLRAIISKDVIFSSYTRTNVIIANGSVSNINLLLSVVKYLDTNIPPTQSDIHIYHLENSDSESMAKTLSNLSSNLPVATRKTPKTPQAAQTLFKERFKVVANKDTNSIIIISAPQDYEKIEEIVRELDVKRAQVLVEALIVEVTLNDDQTLGFDMSALIDTGKGVSALASSNTGLMQQSIQTGGLYAIINANRENTNFKILSTPEIVTLDNQEATISIGEQIPFLTSSRVDENNNVISTYDYKDIGILLKLTPQINNNGYITMNIHQQVKKIVEGTSILENPSVYNREITSRVTVKNERTIVIGGLIRDDTVKIEQKVPVLGDIPLLGLFFRKNTNQRIRTNLLIFITPHIVTEDKDIQTITEKKKMEQKEFEKKEK